MRIEEAIPYVELQLTNERFEHSLRVVKQAVELAEQYGVDTEKAGLAAIFHDYAKNLPLEEMKKVIAASALPRDLLQYHHELWHGPVGSILIKREFGITDVDVQHAVHFHTTGRAQMSKLELIIYVADYIEPGRSFPGVEEVRKMATTDLIHAAWLVTRNTIQFLLQKNAQIYPDTNDAYNDLTKCLFDVKNQQN